jgi:NitT/TauT family transport system ATP-binding protein
MVFQQGALFPWLTAQQNVEFAARNRGTRDRRAARALARSPRAGRGSPARSTSIRSSCRGGMQQRVAIARALALDPADPADGRAVRRARRADRDRDAERAAARLVRTAQDVVFVTHSIWEGADAWPTGSS